jgi:hypothetical protein
MMRRMSTWAARYVRLGEGAERAGDVTRLLRHIDHGVDLVDDGKSRFAVWLVPSPTFQPDDLSALSTELGEAIAIAVQTVADLVIYDHFVAGAHVRGLTYAGEAGWVRVAGDPEPWESKALFSSTRLAELTDALEEDFEGDELEKQKAELERLWTVGKLVEGSPRPPADPSGIARSIEKQFGLPARPTPSPASARQSSR